MQNIDHDIEELYKEVSERAQTEGAYSREEWDQLVETLLEEKREFGEIHDDEGIVEMREVLRARFEDFSSGVDEM